MTRDNNWSFYLNWLAQFVFGFRLVCVRKGLFQIFLGLANILDDKLGEWVDLGKDCRDRAVSGVKLLELRTLDGSTVGKDWWAFSINLV